jgi:hypothetical protein
VGKHVLLHLPSLNWLLQCFAMADWRQIQARIRKAKHGPDAQTKLSELYERTRDAMVAWELGVIEEKAARNDEAAKWYTISAERFRRAEWRKKAEEALTRLGVPLPDARISPNIEESTESFHIPATPETQEAEADQAAPLAAGEIPEGSEERTPSEPLAPGVGAAAASGGERKKRRRGRRGGRGRRLKGSAAVPSLPAEAFSEPMKSPPTDLRPERPQAPRPAFKSSAPEPSRSTRPPRPEAVAPQLPSERAAHGRAGDPALASRMVQLESMLRRLVLSPLHRLDEADEAPAGPGVFLLSDSDQITSYYVEACQTLRVGLGNLVRGGRSAKSVRGVRSYSDSGLKAKLAEHLGISESKVSQYLKDHCVVRWIQLDDDAQHLAHFAIGVLRTPLNLD